MKKKWLFAMFIAVLCMLSAMAFAEDEHEHNFRVVEKPGCEDRGIERCEECGKANKISPIGHSWGGGKSATCTSNGYERKCDRCGKVDGKVSALGHNYKSKVVKPTTSSKGYTEHTCTRCGDSYRDNYKDKLSSSSSGSSSSSSSSSKKKATATPAPAATLAPATETSHVYDLLVSDAQYAKVDDTCALSEDGKTLTVTAAPNADGTFPQRNIHLPVEIIAQMKKDGVQTICFVVGEAALVIPVSAFDAQAAIEEAVKTSVSAFVLTVDPQQELGCMILAVAQMGDGKEVEAGDRLAGMKLKAAGKEIDVTGSGIYSLN